ncbi:YggS family pyridoxal phosphate-dependent enzyme [bacterium]|nr:YggS family pyridoxal phosphate-dependent enzyme [bacterium]
MIQENVKKLLNEIPSNVEFVAAVKTRTVDEIREAVKAGIRIIGENYVQEAIPVLEAFGRSVKYHFIGHLQRNKVKKAVEIFDMIETVDSLKIAEEIDKRCAEINKTMSLLIEVNSGREPQKFGLFPENVEKLIRDISEFKHIQVKGLMTMGPFTGNPEDARPYFIETRNCFEKIKSLNIPNIDMQTLSMGMTNSYRIAIEEGANMIRIGTKIFGERQ